MTIPSDPSELQALIAAAADPAAAAAVPPLHQRRRLDLGSRIVAVARERKLAVTVDIRRHGHQLFHAALPGTTPDNDSWIERKVRVVNRFNDSSYLVGRRLALGRTVRGRSATASTRSCTPRTAGPSRSSSGTSAWSAP